MIVESRACYGFYGEGHGLSGEEPPKQSRGGWQYDYFYFRIDWGDARLSQLAVIKAKTRENAIRQAKAWAKRDGGTFLGDY